MSRPCDVCGCAYTARRATSRFCGGTCAKRAQRAGPAVMRARAAALADDERPVSDLERAVARELEQAGTMQSLRGQIEGHIALELAYRIGSRHESGAATAALAKALRATMDRALGGVTPAAADPLDEIRARRDLKRSAGRL